MTMGGADRGPAAGRVYWITGLSGAGKSTLAKALTGHLRGRKRAVVLLDGDDLRAALGATQAFARSERMALALRYGRLCRMLAGQGLDVVIATVSMFSEVFSWNRANLPGFVEVFLDVPLEELRRRDPKGIYAGIEAGEIRDVAGVDLKVDIPPAPDIRVVWKPSMTHHDVLQFVVERIKSMDQGSETE